MIKNLQNQTGSAYVIIIIILILSLLGALGYIAWQRIVVQKEPESVQQVTNSDTETDQKTYSDDQVSFRYPTSGWTLEVDPPIQGVLTSVRLMSSDYKQSGMGLDEGGLIHVYVDGDEPAFNEVYAELESNIEAYGIEKLEKTIVSGMPAITYNSGYEGPRYRTIFVQNNNRYMVEYQYKTGGDASRFMDTYEIVRNSFKIK